MTDRPATSFHSLNNPGRGPLGSPRPTSVEPLWILRYARFDSAWEMRKNFIPRLGRLQLDLGNGVREYNEREHAGKHCFGKTPLQTFLGAAHLAQEKMLDRLTFGNASDTLGLRAAPERSLHQESAGTAHRTAARPWSLSHEVLVGTSISSRQWFRITTASQSFDF